MKYLWITHDLGKDESGFMAIQCEQYPSLNGEYLSKEGDDATYLRINNDHPNFTGLECEVCGSVIESGWENFDHPRQSVCDDHAIIVNP